MRNRTSDLRIPRSNALPLTHSNSAAREIYYEVHMTRVLYTVRISSVDSVMFVNKIFSLSHARDKTKNISLYFFSELKTYNLSNSIYKHDAIDFANPSSMQDACHMNFVIDLAQW